MVDNAHFNGGSMQRFQCSGCNTLCTDDLVVKDLDGEHYYCGRIGYCRLAIQRHEIAARNRRLDAGFTCSYVIPGSDHCGRESVNILPIPTPHEGRCEIHMSSALPPIQHHTEQVFV